jgi:hypothetical protein
MAELTRAITIEGAPVDQIRAATDAYFRYVERNQPAWEILFGGGAAVAGPAAAEAARLRVATIQFIAAQIRRLAPTADDMTCEAFAHSLSGCAEQLAQWWRRHPHLERDQIVDYHMRFSWPGLMALSRAEFR